MLQVKSINTKTPLAVQSTLWAIASPLLGDPVDLGAQIVYQSVVFRDIPHVQTASKANFTPFFSLLLV